LKRSLSAVCSLAAVLAVLGCGSQELDIADAERTIAKRLGEEQGSKVKVDCPDEVKIKKGDTFDCRATAAGKRPANVRVTQLDDEGRVRWIVTPR
jgi:hypothetical protein